MAQTTIQGDFLGADLVSAQTALTSGLATTDEIIVSDAGVLKRMDISVLEIAATQITASGTLPALNVMPDRKIPFHRSEYAEIRFLLTDIFQIQNRTRLY